MDGVDAAQLRGGGVHPGGERLVALDVRRDGLVGDVHDEVVEEAHLLDVVLDGRKQVHRVHVALFATVEVSDAMSVGCHRRAFPVAEEEANHVFLESTREAEGVTALELEPLHLGA